MFKTNKQKTWFPFITWRPVLEKHLKLLQLTALSNRFDLLNISMLGLSLKENKGRWFLRICIHSQEFEQDASSIKQQAFNRLLENWATFLYVLKTNRLIFNNPEGSCSCLCRTFALLLNQVIGAGQPVYKC